MTGATVKMVGLESVVTRLQSLPDEIRASIETAVAAGCMLVEARAKEKLSGEVLNNRTGQLRASIHSQLESTDTSVIGVVGANTPYAAFQEYGFVGVEQVREHMRKLTQAFGRPVATPRDIMIKAHQRQVNYPAHSYLRSSLAENAGTLTSEIRMPVTGRQQ
jgi:phage gpG-like protein